MPKEEKKKKLSKKERKRLEAEQKAAEEERLRIEDEKAKELAEKQRIENEIKTAAEKAQFRKEELERLQKEYDEELFNEQDRKHFLNDYFASKEASDDWGNYLECSELPSLKNRRDIYNFITTMAEDDHISLEEVHEQCSKICSFIFKLYSKSVYNTVFHDLLQIYTPLSYIVDLTQLLFKRIDWCTANLLENLHTYIASGITELKLNYKNDLFKYGLWCNLGQKVLRMKQVKCDEIGIFLEMPKQIAVMKIALRILIVELDLISQFIPSNSQPEVTMKVLKEGQITPLHHKLAEQDHNIWRETCKEADGSIRNYIKIFDGKEYNLSKLTYNELPDELKLISLNRSQNIKDWNDWNNESRELYPFGGIIYLELIELPEPLKLLKGWECQKIDSFWTEVNIVPYPPQTTTAQVIQAIKVRYTVPASIMIKESVRLGYFNSDSKIWIDEGFSEIEFDPTSRVLSFSTTHLGILTMLGRRNADFPYQNWRIYCNDLGDGFLEIETVRYKYIFKVTKEGVELIEPVEPELETLMNRIMLPSDLLIALKRSGINLMPTKSVNEIYNNKDEKYVLLEDDGMRNIELKEYELEMECYKQIPQITYAFESSRSNWNASSPPNEIVFSVVESSLGNDPETKSLFMVEVDGEVKTGVKTTILGFNDYFEDFDKDNIKGMSHLHMRQCMEYISTEDGIELIHKSNAIFEENMRELLCFTRPLSFSV